MDRSCFMCHKSFPGGMDGLANHFSFFHGISLSNESNNIVFVCDENNCGRSFKYFRNFRRHVDRCHTSLNSHHPIIINNNHHHDENINMEVIDDPHRENLFEVVEDGSENSGQEGNNSIFNSRSFVVEMIIKFHANPSMTGSAIKNVLEENEKFLSNYHYSLTNKIIAELVEGQVINANLIEKIQEKIQFDSPFKDLKYYDQQINAMVNNSRYIAPKEIPLGDRIDQVLNKKTCRYEPKEIIETLQYVPIIEVLKIVLSNRKIREAINNEKFLSDNILGSFIDGQYFKIHPFFQKYKNALRIKLYYDELEIVNPLGSKTGVHKLGVFYYQISNLPKVMNSKLDSIHILAVFSYADVHYGFDKILSLFLEDLEKLESNEGVPINFENEVFILRASIESFCGDGLAVHEVFNLLGPAANFFCRMCMFSRNDLHSGRLEKRESRTEQLFNQQLDFLRNSNFSNASKTATGIKGSCCLNKSRYFKIWNNKIFDIMHDWLNGLLQMVIKLILWEYVINQKKFDIEFLNGAIKSFDYGFLDFKNKPSANFTENMLKKNDHTLSQKACQMWCLTRALPFILCEKVDRKDKHMKLLLYMLRIMELVFAPKINSSLLPYLSGLIEEFINFFIELFPTVHLINKFHHITHYPECIAWLGPLVNYWCMRFEGYHAILKLRAQNMHNFKNPQKTVVHVCQSVQSSKWGQGDVEVENFEILNGSMKFVCNTLSRQKLQNRNLSDDDQVFCAKAVKINGVEFRKNLFVILQKETSNESGRVLFGRIEEIIILENKIFFLVKKKILFSKILFFYFPAY